LQILGLVPVAVIFGVAEAEVMFIGVNKARESTVMSDIFIRLCIYRF
jgi:hypothetical protein